MNNIINQNRQFHRDNYLFVKNELLQLQLEELNNNELADIGEVIGCQVFTYLSEMIPSELNLVNERFEFAEKFSALDVISKNSFYEIKVRKPSLNQRYIREYSPFKLHKYNTAKRYLDFFNVYYLMICFDRIFIYDIGKHINIIDYRANNKRCWKTLDAKNDKTNLNKVFLPLHMDECNEVKFTDKMKEELAPYFNIVEQIEKIKTDRNG